MKKVIKKVKKIVKKPVKKVVKKVVKKIVSKEITEKHPIFKIKEVPDKIIVTEEVDGEDIVIKEVPKVIYPIEIGRHPISGKRELKNADGTTFYED